MASWVFALLVALGQFGQTNTGELRRTVWIAGCRSRELRNRPGSSLSRARCLGGSRRVEVRKARPPRSSGSSECDEPVRCDQLRGTVFRDGDRRPTELFYEVAARFSIGLLRAIPASYFFSITTTPHGLPPVDTFFSTLPLATSTIATSPLGPLAV